MKIKIIVRYENDTIEEFLLEQNEILVGRNKKNHVLVKDILVSREHCKFFLNDQNQVVVENISSTNGIIVDDIIVSKKVFESKNGEFRIGNSYISFQLLENEKTNVMELSEFEDRRSLNEEEASEEVNVGGLEDKHETNETKSNDLYTHFMFLVLITLFNFLYNPSDLLGSIFTLPVIWLGLFLPFCTPIYIAKFFGQKLNARYYTEGLFYFINLLLICSILEFFILGIGNNSIYLFYLVCIFISCWMFERRYSVWKKYKARERKKQKRKKLNLRQVFGLICFLLLIALFIEEEEGKVKERIQEESISSTDTPLNINFLTPIFFKSKANFNDDYDFFEKE